MKQNIGFTYTEEYLPTPRCRKFREREVTSSIAVCIKECKKEEAPLVMSVKTPFSDDTEIRIFRGKLYRNVQWWNVEEGKDKNETCQSIDWQFYLWGQETYNDCKWSNRRGDAHSKKAIKNRASKLLVVDGMVFERTTEPVYNITCFGLNDSVGMFVEYRDRFSTQKGCYSALEREECHEELKDRLAHCRNIYDNYPYHVIEVFDEQWVKFRHKK